MQTSGIESFCWDPNRGTQIKKGVGFWKQPHDSVVYNSYLLQWLELRTKNFFQLFDSVLTETDACAAVRNKGKTSMNKKQEIIFILFAD